MGFFFSFLVGTLILFLNFNWKPLFLAKILSKETFFFILVSDCKSNLEEEDDSYKKKKKKSLLLQFLLKFMFPE